MSMFFLDKICLNYARNDDLTPISRQEVVSSQDVL